MARNVDALQPGAIAATWIARVRDGAAKYKVGIQATKVNPMALAAAQQGFWAQRVAEAARNNKFANALNRVRFTDWQQMALTVGADRLANLPDAKRQKTQAFWTRWLPTLQSVTKQVQSMPNATYADRRARALAQMDGLHNAAMAGAAPGAGGGM